MGMKEDVEAVKADTALTDMEKIVAAAAIKMKTAVVILNWNTEGFLKDFLPSLLRSVENVERAEVIVADNASTDSSMTLMKEMFPQVRTIAFDRNWGFTGGYNKALSQIEAEYYVLINSDIEISEGWLEPLVEWMDLHQECGACAPKLHSWYERDNFEYAGAAGGYIDHFAYPFCRGRVMGRVEKDRGQYDKCDRRVFWASGACLMVRSGLFHRLGGLDERFFAHMEEIDLCWRIQLEGYTVCVIPESVVYHVGGGTLPSTSPFKLFLNYRNNLLMLDNNLSKTLALKEFRLSGKPDTAARKGLRKARQRIFIRLCLDGLSAAVYLLTLNFKSFKSVCKAHKEYRSMRQSPAYAQVLEYLSNKGRAEIFGIYNRWIVLQALLKGKNIFVNIRERDFLKF